MAIVEGFGGKRMRDGKLFLNPIIHEKWRKYTFCILLKDHPLQVAITKETVSVLYKGTAEIVVNIYGKDRKVVPNRLLKIERVRVPQVQTKLGTRGIRVNALVDSNSILAVRAR